MSAFFLSVIRRRALAAAANAVANPRPLENPELIKLMKLSKSDLWKRAKATKARGAKWRMPKLEIAKRILEAS